MAWETFKGRNTRQTETPLVTFSKTGGFRLNAKLVKEVVKDSQFATLMFDRDKQLVGIKLEKTGTVDNYPIHRNPKDTSATISGVSFFKAYDIFPKETHRYTPSLDQKDNIIIIELNEKKKNVKEIHAKSA